jgi:DnaK suppressor protein
MATALPSPSRKAEIATVQRLAAAAKKAADRAASAKKLVKTTKAQLKQVRKAFRAEKKAAKQARKKLETARNTLMTKEAGPASLSAPPAKAAPAKKPVVRKAVPKAAPDKPKSRRKARRPPKASAGTASKPLRSAAEVAKSVIERLHRPPPSLPPAPLVPSQVADAEPESAKASES